MWYVDKTKVATDEEISRIALSEVFKEVIPSFKISFLGNDGVGKTTLSTNYLKPVFDRETKQTIGCEFFNKEITITGLKIKFQCWIIPVNEQFKFIYTRYILGSRVIALMYDITNFNTLISLNKLIQRIREDHPEISIILVGNKLDLVEHRDVLKESVIAIAIENRLVAYIEISSKTGENIEELFDLIVKIILKSTQFERDKSYNIKEDPRIAKIFRKLRLKEKIVKKKV
jgi:small GTP-binding protein